MIHGNSTDPVFIKKIGLNIWTLRDEIEVVVEQKIKENEKALTPEEIEAIRQEYTLGENARAEARQNISTLLPKDKIRRGMCVLSEIEIGRLCFFAPQSYIEGQSIVLEFLIPKMFVANAEVVHCRYFNIKGRVIGNNKLPYRIVAQFTFLKEGERALLRQFVESIQIKPASKFVAKEKAKDEDNSAGESQKQAA